MTVPLPDLFKRVTLAPGGVRINTLVGGNDAGPPVLLLHGYPQTHVMWHHVAPILALDHTVVLTDLRGYGDSGKPPGGATHEGYAKRTMGWDQALVMRDLGFEQFAVVGHDRGARVAHRLALDCPQSVTKLAVLDIVPTYEAYARADMAFGLGAPRIARAQADFDDASAWPNVFISPFGQPIPVGDQVAAIPYSYTAK